MNNLETMNQDKLKENIEQCKKTIYHNFNMIFTLTHMTVLHPERSDDLNDCIDIIHEYYGKPAIDELFSLLSLEDYLKFSYEVDDHYGCFNLIGQFGGYVYHERH